MAFGGQRPRTMAVIPQASPFARAHQIWARRDGDGRAQARNWRIMAFAMTATAMIFAGGFVYEATRIRIAAYYVPINELGRPGRIMLIGDQYTPGRGEISYFLQNWVKTMFEKSIDPVTQGGQLKTTSVVNMAACLAASAQPPRCRTDLPWPRRDWRGGRSATGTKGRSHLKSRIIS